MKRNAMRAIFLMCFSQVYDYLRKTARVIFGPDLVCRKVNDFHYNLLLHYDYDDMEND